MTQDEKELLSLLPKRHPDAHKGSFGRLLLIGGSPNMTGCMVLAAEGALRSGVGILECACETEVSHILKLRVSEAVHTTIPDPFSDFDSCSTILIDRLQSSSALAIGPGLAGGAPGSERGKAVRDLIFLLLYRSECPVILDADGLTVFGDLPELLRPFGKRLVITPHPGELSCLTQQSIPEIRNNRTQSALSFSKQYGCVTLLKGHQSVIAAPDGRLSLNPTGNPYLARGGSGDVLTGIIGSLLAQGLSPYDAARLGAYLHGGAADLAARELGLSMLPSDLAIRIGRFINGQTE